jgi:hypothetical protein
MYQLIWRFFVWAEFEFCCNVRTIVHCRRNSGYWRIALNYIQSRVAGALLEANHDIAMSLTAVE